METMKGRDAAIKTPALAGPMGEVVEASTTGFRSVAVEAFEPPPFGGFVKTVTEGRTTYAVVSNVEQASVDPSRRAVPLGRTWDEIRKEQPQVLELLTTEFDAVCVAFRETPEGPAHPYLPPTPPRVHDFVYACEPDEVRGLTTDTSFVRTLAATGSPMAAELIAASIRAAAEARPDGGRSFLLRAGREVAELYRQDYDQARAVLRRLGMRVMGENRDRSVPDRVALRRESDR